MATTSIKNVCNQFGGWQGQGLPTFHHHMEVWVGFVHETVDCLKRKNNTEILAQLGEINC